MSRIEPWLRTFVLSMPFLALSAGAASAEVFQPTGPPRPAVIRELAGDLFRLTSVVSAGDDRLFLTQQGGLVHIYKEGALLPEPFLDLRSLVSTGGELGLLSLAFHPRYLENGLLFAAYTDLEMGLTIARYQVSADPDKADPASALVVLNIPKKYQEHSGGQLQFGPDGYLYLSVGDGGSEGHVGGDPECVAQQGNTLFGKILRLDVDHSSGDKPYAIPPDNPFRGSTAPGAMPEEVWALGLRNPWRFSFDRLTGDMYIGDVGEDQREEIDFEPAGSPGGLNYGWKVMEGTACFATDACPATTPPCGSPAYTPPMLEYGHEDDRCSVSGGYLYRGTALPHLYGSYIFGDQCNGQLWAAERPTGDRRGQWKVRELPPRALYVTSFGEDRHGEIHLTTLDGRLWSLSSPHPVDTVALWEPSTARLLLKDLHLSGPEGRTVQLASRGHGQIPLAGDWDGDGRTTLGLYDPRKFTFRLKSTLAQSGADLLLTFHPASGGAVPIVGDWDGDGRDTVGFYERAKSLFELKNTHQGDRPDLAFRFGPSRSRWIPVAGDWDGDGKDGIGLYDPERGIFRLKNGLSGGDADLVLRFGMPKAGWIPLAGDWDGDGKDGLALYDPTRSVFLLKSDLAQGPADWEVRFGVPAGRVPLCGEW